MTTDAGSSAETAMKSALFSRIPRRLVVVENKDGDWHALRDLRSHDVVLVRNCRKSTIAVAQNQRLSGVVMVGCTECKLDMLDSAVVVSRTVRLVDCRACEAMIEDVDVRKVEAWGTTGTRVVLIGDDALVEKCHVIWHSGCSGNSCVVGDMIPSSVAMRVRYNERTSAQVPPSVEASKGWLTTFCPVTHVRSCELSGDEARAAIAKGLTAATTPCVLECDAELASTLPAEPSLLMSTLQRLEATPYAATQQELDAAYDEEHREFTEPMEDVMRKAGLVAQMLKKARHCVVYSGAGISTSSGIPDFRGPAGAWTMRDKGGFAEGKELGEASPTLAHYAITELARRRLVKFVVTTNMDALHAASGLPRHLLEELHGCVYKEHCAGCGMQFVRDREVHGWGRSHETGDHCTWCDGPLMDTIVHFSDTYRSDLEPVIAKHHATKCDLALVLGTSMCVQPAASYPDRCLNNPGANLVIVNLQRTPCDDLATLRIFARTDVFMACLMHQLAIEWFPTTYDARLKDWGNQDSLFDSQLSCRKLQDSKSFAEFNKSRKQSPPSNEPEDLSCDVVVVEDKMQL